MSIDIAGPAVVTASDIVGDAQVEICDPSLPIATLNEEGRLKLQARVEMGRGYIAAEKNLDDALGIGWIPVDSAHSPVRRVNYRVEAARLGRMTDYEKLILEIWTDGTITPERALTLASNSSPSTSRSSRRRSRERRPRRRARPATGSRCC